MMFGLILLPSPVWLCCRVSLLRAPWSGVLQCSWTVLYKCKFQFIPFTHSTSYHHNLVISIFHTFLWESSVSVKSHFLTSAKGDQAVLEYTVGYFFAVVRQNEKKEEAVAASNNLSLCFTNQTPAKQVLPSPPLSMYQYMPRQKYFSNFDEWHTLTLLNKKHWRNIYTGDIKNQEHSSQGGKYVTRKYIFQNPPSHCWKNRYFCFRCSASFCRWQCVLTQPYLTDNSSHILGLVSSQRVSTGTFKKSIKKVLQQPPMVFWPFHISKRAGTPPGT